LPRGKVAEQKEIVAMSPEIDPELAEALEMEARANRIRAAMWADAGFIAAVKQGLAAEQAGEMVTLAELDREFPPD
jgi:hypothetical protein